LKESLDKALKENEKKDKDLESFKAENEKLKTELSIAKEKCENNAIHIKTLNNHVEIKEKTIQALQVKIRQYEKICVVSPEKKKVKSKSF